MNNKTFKVTLRSNGAKIEVYKSKLRDTYINYSDCTTEYKKEELIF